MVVVGVAAVIWAVWKTRNAYVICFINVLKTHSVELIHYVCFWIKPGLFCRNQVASEMYGAKPGWRFGTGMLDWILAILVVWPTKWGGDEVLWCFSTIRSYSCLLQMFSLAVLKTCIGYPSSITLMGWHLIKKGWHMLHFFVMPNFGRAKVSMTHCNCIAKSVYDMILGCWM